MQTLILPYSDTDTEIIAFIDRLRVRKKPFTIEPIEPHSDDSDAVKTNAIRERLRLKYVVSGEWSDMDDDDRQDAALLESMLYDDENGDVELLSEAEQLEFRNEMKSWSKK